MKATILDLFIPQPTSWGIFVLTKQPVVGLCVTSVRSWSAS